MRRFILILLTLLNINCSNSFESKTQEASQASESDLAKNICRRTTIPNPPQNLTASATPTAVRLSWSLSSSLDVITYEIRKNNTLLMSLPQTSSSYEESGLASSTQYTYTVVAKNSCGKFSSAISVTVSTLSAPVVVAQDVNILAPSNGSTVSGRVSVSASVSGFMSPISLQWRVDGANIGAPVSLSPFALSLDTSLLTNGSHQLSANITDSTNATMTDAIVFNVNNVVMPPVEPTTPEIQYSPALINYSAEEIVNPLRGLYKWRGNEIYRLNAPAADVYDRYTWRNLETSRDVYNFTALENAISAAAANGAKFGFRVRSMIGYGDNTMHVPDYMAAYGWWADTNRDGTVDTYIPDWNHAFYLDRATRLLLALGARYGNDPRVAWLDMGLYGQYGEWTLSSSSVDYSRAPAGVVAVTAQTKRTLIDAHVRAFPRTQLVMFLLYSNFEALLYAYSLPTEKPIGSRVDCLGQAGFFTQWTNRPDYWNQVKDRWRVAPFISEYCSGSIQFDNPNSQDDALGQVETFHISMIGNGNMNWSSLSSTDQNNYINVGKRSGYRVSLSQLRMPSTLTRERASSLITSWLNQGVAPIYETWNVVIELRNPQSRTRVYQKILNVPLKSLLPASMPTDYTDSLTIPSSVPAGNYEVVLKVVDPVGYRKNLILANEGASVELDYLVGMIQLR